MSQAKLSAIEKAQKHFQTKLTTELKHLHVKEWELDIYYRDIHTLRTESKIVELAQAGKSVEALVQTILSKALDKEGKLLFTQYDKDALLNDADPAVVLNISRVLSGGDLPQVSEIEKN
jgi:Cdc6-like AAA superfamily ATPase